MFEADAVSARTARDAPGDEAASGDALQVQRELARLRREQHDLERFRVLLASRFPIATYALVASIALVFALQYLWGGVDLPPLLRSMGSMVADRARAGEWWRYLSCTFLHGGLLHAALNTLVLWLLGRSVERLIGTARFLIIYFSAGLCGSLLSSWFVSSQSVGASGAIWGLLGAEMAMAFYPRPLLPPALVGIARRTATANLGLNLVNSFNPHIDFAAHVGGGLMGAGALVLLAATGQLSANGRAPARAGIGLQLIAGSLACLFVAGLSAAIITGRPWQLDAAPASSGFGCPAPPGASRCLGIVPLPLRMAADFIWQRGLRPERGRRQLGSRAVARR